MKENSAKYFSNQACKYYPCHKVEDAEEFNCLFCYCPTWCAKPIETIFNVNRYIEIKLQNADKP